MENLITLLHIKLAFLDSHASLRESLKCGSATRMALFEAGLRDNSEMMDLGNENRSVIYAK